MEAAQPHERVLFQENWPCGTAALIVILAGVVNAASADVYSLAPLYEGQWVDPNFIGGDGQPVNGSAMLELDLITDTGSNDDLLVTMTLGGSPGVPSLPSFLAVLEVQPDGSIAEIGIEFPSLDGDLVFNTGADNFPTPTMDFQLAVDGTLAIVIHNPMAFGRIDAVGTWTADLFSITADVLDANGGLISGGGTVIATPIPAPAGLMVAGCGLVVLSGRSRRR